MTRINQLVKWCGKDFDGCLVFDECHKAKNLVVGKEEKSSRTARHAAQAGVTRWIWSRPCLDLNLLKLAEGLSCKPKWLELTPLKPYNDSKVGFLIPAANAPRVPRKI